MTFHHKRNDTIVHYAICHTPHSFFLLKKVLVFDYSLVLSRFRCATCRRLIPFCTWCAIVPHRDRHIGVNDQYCAAGTILPAQYFQRAKLRARKSTREDVLVDNRNIQCSLTITRYILVLVGETDFPYVPIAQAHVLRSPRG